MNLPPRAVLPLILLLIGQPIKPNIFGDIANNLKHKQESIDTGIGKAVGVKLGAVLETATAPALDNAAAKFSELTKSAAGQLDQSLAAENESIDLIARQNIGRIDALTQTTLNKVDTLVDDRLQRVERDANGILNREALIVDNALTRENSIANNALDRVQTISDQSLDRLQNIEGDAFDRIDSALQDEVPVAASQVAHEFVIAALVVACIVALFGFAGISLWKNLQAAKDNNASMSQILKNGFSSFWRTLPQQAVVVAIPTVLIAAAILAGYEAYLRSTQAMRTARLEKAAVLLESAGEYKLAGELRRRVLAVDGENDGKRKEFVYQADLWLADFTQKRSVSLSDLLKRLQVLESNDLSKANGDLRAASLYLNPNTGAITQYKGTFLQGKTALQVPFLGKLALMAQIKAALDCQAPATSRVESALKETQDLRTLYPNYANGYILAAAFTGMQADVLLNGENRDPNQQIVLRKQVSAGLERAAALDPDLMRVVRLTTLDLPQDILKDLDENPRTPSLAARLSTFASNGIDPLARVILTSDVLTHLAVDRTILQASRRGIGERRIAHAIASLPISGSDPSKRASAMASIAQQYLDINSYLPAERWVQSARKALQGAQHSDSSLSKLIDSIGQAVQQSPISDGLSAVI